MSGELLLAIAYGGAMIFAGAVAYRIVERGYASKSRREEDE